MLINELATRKLDPTRPTAPKPRADRTVDKEENADPIDWNSYVVLASVECTFYFPTDREAAEAYAWLDENDVDAAFLSRSDGRIADLRGPRLIVLPDDAERAAMLLAQPIPARLNEEPEAEPEDFVPPACPRCSTSDPVLESVEPTNHWRCENCGHEWDDPEPPTED